MDCLTVNREELAEKYLQGKLDSARQDEFETHLLECAKCTQELELLQALRRDLAGRAHEIRGWTPRKAFFFRWQAVAIAALLVVVIAGSIAIRQRKQNNTIAVLLPPEANRLPAPTASENTTTTLTKPPVPGAIPETTQKAKKTEVASATKPKKTGNLPVNGRDYIDFTLTNSQGARDNTPVIGPAPSSGRVSSPEANANGKSAQENAPGTQPVPVQVAEEKPKSALPPGDTHEKPELTTAQGVELYNLGNVVAPPFTFTGFSSKFFAPGAGATNSHSRGRQAADSNRKLFREGMTSYVNGNYKEAREFLEQAAKVEPNAGDVQYYLGVCQLLTGNPESAIDTLKRARTMNSAAHKQAAHYYLAKAFVQTMKLQEAEDEFRSASEMPGPLKGDSAVLLGRLKTLRAQLGTN